MRSLSITTLTLAACLNLTACAVEPHKVGTDTPANLNAAERDELTRLGNENRTRIEKETRPGGLSPAAKTEATEIIPSKTKGTKP